MGSVRAACRMLGVDYSTSSRWQRQLVRFGTEILRPRERRRPRMPNAISPMVEHRVLALALANPGWGSHRLSLELGRPKWGGLRISGNGIWRVLKRHGLNTRAKRLGSRLRRAAGARAPAGPSGAPHQGRPPWSSSADGLLLHRPAERPRLLRRALAPRCQLRRPARTGRSEISLSRRGRHDGFTAALHGQPTTPGPPPERSDHLASTDARSASLYSCPAGLGRLSAWSASPSTQSSALPPCI
jgi:transposase